ncbi:hemolysin family protein [Tunturiibacter empetritectus]|uniref:CBS domain containing-hemolysin-like protein n=2 Tax=Tunturiibacter TaxID=3154218 RepID=A0A852VC36_9BACT|nr:hemolysin family protein [Edaphobacter lichenicola]NYF90443.1 CBS domain containing-hemolysin-like protein [Edaphobacter lichenicola]
MLEWMLFRIIMVAFFILASSFFVAAEFALVSVRETRIQQLIALGRPGARTVLKLKHSIDEFLPAVQLGVTVAGLALGWIGEPAVAEIILNFLGGPLHRLPAHAVLYAHTAAVIFAFSLITYFEVLLGELVPKSLALQRTERIALAVAGPMDVFIRLTRPIVKLMNSSAALVLRLFRAPLRGEGAVHSPEELKLIATATRRMGLLPVFQEEIIHRAIELNHVTVREIMTPRGSIFSLSADLPLQQASARIVEEQHSRVPVYDPVSGPEHIIGIVYSKDISRLMHFRTVALSLGGKGESGLTLRQVMRELTVVPETKLAIELLQEFQERRRHIAIVVDEFGSTVGLVTAEDVLEQIVGELEDEFDVSKSPLLSTTGAMVLDGSTTLRDLGNQLHWTFPREPGVETLAGFLLANLGHIPAAGESVEHGGRRYEVAEMAGRRISRVIVEDVAPPPNQVEDEADSREAIQ